MLTDVSTTFAVVISVSQSANVVETSVNINTNSPSQDFTNLDDLYPQTCNDVDTPGFKAFTLFKSFFV